MMEKVRKLINRNILSLSIFVIFILFLNKISIAKDISPGLVITKDNYNNYINELKNLMPESLFKVTLKQIKNGWITIPIVSFVKPIPKSGIIKWSKKNKGSCKLGPGGELLNWVTGPPFPNPKSGIELAWDFQLIQYYEQAHFDMDFDLYNKNDSLERTIGNQIWVMLFSGRMALPPIPQIYPDLPPERQIWVKLLTRITYPFDAKDFIIVRTRYLNVNKDDDAWAYIPTIRRIRRFTGADLQDPIMGTDHPMDDLDGWSQKLNPKIMNFKLLGKKIFLLPAYSDREPITKDEYIRGEKGGAFQTNWVKRKCWVLQVNINDPSYMYSRRVLYFDAETGDFRINYEDMYDQRKRLWRTYLITWHRSFIGRYQAIIDHQTGHYTITPMTNQKRDDPNMNPDDFVLRNLIRRMR